MLQEHVASDWSSGVCTTYLCSTTLYTLALRSVTLAGSGVTRGMDAELVTRPRRRSSCPTTVRAGNGAWQKSYHMLVLLLGSSSASLLKETYH
jgi:hypothetical protein